MAIEKELVVAGLTRDCAHSLPKLLETLSKLAERFQTSHFIFLENDSLDSTKKILKTFADQRQNAHIEFHDKIGKMHPKRTARLAVLRNRIIEIANQMISNPQEAYLLLLDMDGANSFIDEERIINHIVNDDGNWAGLFANQKTEYYDLWALRHPEYCPYDIWEKVRNRPEEMSKKEAIDKFITAIRFTLPENTGLVEVESAFGGLGLYRFSTLENCVYAGLDSEGNEICEHVAFNAQIRANGGMLFIDGGLINAVGNEPHEPAKSKFEKKIDKLRLFIRQL